MLDGDEKVRAAVCKVYAQLDYESVLHHVSVAQLMALAERMLDRKVCRPLSPYWLFVNKTNQSLRDRIPFDKRLLRPLENYTDWRTLKCEHIVPVLTSATRTRS